MHVVMPGRAGTDRGPGHTGTDRGPGRGAGHRQGPGRARPMSPSPKTSSACRPANGSSPARCRRALSRARPRPARPGSNSGDLVISVEHAKEYTRVIAGFRNCQAVAFQEAQTGNLRGHRRAARCPICSRRWSRPPSNRATQGADGAEAGCEVAVSGEERMRAGRRSSSASAP